MRQDDNKKQLQYDRFGNPMQSLFAKRPNRFLTDGNGQYVTISQKQVTNHAHSDVNHAHSDVNHAHSDVCRSNQKTSLSNDTDHGDVCTNTYILQSKL